MEHFTRITFWIVTLFCLQASSLPVEESQIPFMRIRVKCLSDSKFYAPKNVEKSCITTALDCVMRELDGTVREECTDNNEDIDQAVDVFEAAIKERTSEGHAMTNSSACTCENWSQEPFTKFLDKVETLLHFATVVASE